MRKFRTLRRRLASAIAVLLLSVPASAAVLLGDRASLPVDGAPISLAVLDVDLDGIPDIVTANESGGDGASISVLPGYGNGSFRPEERLNLNPARYLVHRVLGGDFDGNGDPDLAVAVDDISVFPPQASVFLYASNGAGQFARPVPYPLDGTFPHCLGSGDIDADGDADLIACVADAESGLDVLSLLVNAGDGTFALGEPRALGFTSRSVEVADVDADGVDDVLVADADADDGGIRIYYGAADDGLAAEAELVSLATVPSSVRVVSDSDANLPMLVVTSVLDSQILRFSQQPARTFTLRATQLVDDPPSDAVGVDVDLDGEAELVVLSASNNRLSVYDAGGEPLERRQRLTVDALAAGLIVADFNADGRPDVAVPATGTDSANVFLNGESAAGTPDPTVPEATPTPTSPAVATPTAPCTPGPDPDSPCGHEGPTYTATVAVPPTATPTPTATVREFPPSHTPTATATPLPDPGDANCDGYVDEADVSAIVFQMFQPWCEGADVNSDGMMSAADIVLLMEMLEDMP